MKIKDIIAILVLVAFVLLRLKGINGFSETIVTMVLTYYFVKRREGKDNGD